MTDDLAAFPSTIGLTRAQPPRQYRRRDELVAIRGALPPDIPAAEGEPLAPGITLVPSSLAHRAEDATVTAVYSLDPGGQPLVPTGRVLLRFGEGDRATDRREAIERAGYRVVGALGYAPHAAWVESPQGAARALRDLEQLEALAGVVHVEPEMVGRRANR